LHELGGIKPGQFVHSVYAQCDNIGSMYKLEDHIKWYARKKDDFLQLFLDDRENKFGEILTKLNLINSENVCVNDTERNRTVRRQEAGKNYVYLFVFCMNLGELNALLTISCCQMKHFGNVIIY
jgi:hypothetical protein